MLSPAICRSCGLVLIEPMWTDEDKAAVIPSSRQLHRARLAEAPVEAGFRRMRHRAARCMQCLQRYVRPGEEVLEIGAGDGTLLQMLRDHGARVTGTDLDPHGARFVKEKLGIPMVVAPFEEADFGGRRFDAIVSAHVIEHVFEPVSVLARAWDLLKPGGLIFLETPNILRPKVGPRRLFSIPHNFYFSPRTLALSLRKAGFMPIAVREYHCDSFQIVARRVDGESTTDPSTHAELCGDNWQVVAERIRSYPLRYLTTLQFLWRKIPGLKNAMLYHMHRDLSGDQLDRWLRRAA